MKTLLLLLVLFAFSACHREDPYPELRDPIYEDLLHDLQEKTAARDDAQKQVESLKKSIADSQPRTSERAEDKMALRREEKLYQKLIQEVEYAKIRTERRRVEGRRDYKIAFLKGKEWPDPEEYKRYLLSKKLNSVSESWSSPPKHEK